jgi:hypothetical protein
MPNLEKGTVIAWMKCPCCDKESRILLNVNGNAYFTCKWPRSDTGNVCMRHERWGKDDSQKMQRDFIAHKKTAKEANINGRPSTIQEQPANENSEPKRPAKERSKAFYES